MIDNHPPFGLHPGRADQDATGDKKPKTIIDVSNPQFRGSYSHALGRMVLKQLRKALKNRRHKLSGDKSGVETQLFGCNVDCAGEWLRPVGRASPDPLVRGFLYLRTSDHVINDRVAFGARWASTTLSKKDRATDNDLTIWRIRQRKRFDRAHRKLMKRLKGEDEDSLHKRKVQAEKLKQRRQKKAATDWEASTFLSRFKRGGGSWW
jgi:hypothetical protein